VTEFVICAAMHVGTGSRRGRNASIRTRGNRPLVPASTWKGLFSARAGYIIRSCWGKSAACKKQSDCEGCLLCSLFGSTTRRGRLAFRDSPVLDEVEQRRPERSHVAIDRISGGGRDKLLFTDDVVTSGRVRLTITSLGTVADWERDLLLHIVRDIHDGLIGVGGGTQRGQGTLQLADPSHRALTALRPLPAQPPVAEAAHD
jgi:CRISPR/Cas system CSM-associated protein Csm3 (group 7 of RAMP superfamily)